MLLKLTDLTVCYEQITAVNKASLHLNEGEIAVVLGANGAGKSSLMGAVAGLIPSKSGSLLLEGMEMLGSSAHTMVKNGVSLVPEGRHVVGGMTVEENLLLSTTKRRCNGKLEEIYSELPILKERSKQRAGLLSGGEQQMLAIARAMMAEPKILLIDEPTLGLAPKISQQVLSLIHSLKKKNTTILLVEQNVRQAVKISDRVYSMNKGILQEKNKQTEHEIFYKL